MTLWFVPLPTTVKMPPIVPTSLFSTTSALPKSITKHIQHRHASTSILFALSSLSNSREIQHFNKLTKLSRVEHSPPLQLIRSSEIEPYPLPEPPRRAALLPFRSSNGRRRDATSFYSPQALAVGRAVLARQARDTAVLQRALLRSQRREMLREEAVERERRQWQKKERRLQNDMRVAGLWILASVGTATGLAMWRFWPHNAAGGVDSGELARKIAEKAKAAAVLPAEKIAAITSDAATGASPAAPPPLVAGAFAALPAAPVAPPVQKPAVLPASESTQSATKVSWSSWIGGLFWKKSA